MDKLITAYRFASVKHEDQRRKNKKKSPYINHPIDVAKILLDAGVTDPDIICAGILHDTLEDTETSYDELLCTFGKEIADMVAECSDDKSLFKLERKKQQIEHAKHISTGAKLVKLADKYSNLSGLVTDPPAHWSLEEVVGYAVWGYAVFSNLKGVNAVMEERLTHDVFDHFGLTGVDVNSYEFLIKLNSYYAIHNLE